MQNMFRNILCNSFISGNYSGSSSYDNNVKSSSSNSSSICSSSSSSCCLRLVTIKKLVGSTQPNFAATRP